MSIMEIMKLVVELGILTVIAIFYLYNRQKQADKISQHYEKLLESREEELKEFMGLACENIKQNLIRVLNVPQLTEEYLDNDSILSEFNIKKIVIMQEALDRLEADRILFFSYHNNEKNYLGHSYQRMSCENEVMKAGLAGIQHRFLNMFRTSVYYTYKEILEGKTVIFHDIKNAIEKDPTLGYLVSAEGMGSCYCVGVKAPKSKYNIGSLIIIFKESKVRPDIDKELHGLSERLTTLYLVENDKIKG